MALSFWLPSPRNHAYAWSRTSRAHLHDSYPHKLPVVPLGRRCARLRRRTNRTDVSRVPRFAKGGASRSSRTLSAGCGGRRDVRRIYAQTTDDVTDGQAVWSWHPEADAKLAMMFSHRADDGGQQARQPADVPMNPPGPGSIAFFECPSQPPNLKGCDDRLNPPVDPAEPVVPAPRNSSRTGAMGIGRYPVFPALSFRGG